jgi:TPR repeat protein
MSPERVAAAAAPRTRGLAWVSLWIVAFTGLSAANGVGDHHPGHTVPFWDRACQDGRLQGCRNLAAMHARYCSGGSGWACNELGILGATGRASTAPAQDLFERGCLVGFLPACANRASPQGTTPPAQRGDPRLQDYLQLLQEGRGPLPDQTPEAVFTRACGQGWVAGCASLGDVLFASDKRRARDLWAEACDRAHAPSCWNLAVMYRLGDGTSPDNARSAQYLARACALGSANACARLDELRTEGF